MGTRNLTKVIKGGKTVVAQYGQWDGYPSYSGIEALKFLRDPENIKALDETVDLCWQGTAEEFENAIASVGSCNGWMDSEQAEMYKTLYPSLTRDTGIGILEVIANSNGVILNLDPEFENDTLMCEGVYTVDLDRREFITRYDRLTVFSLDNLPTDEAYLAYYREEAA
jgi:hypothetical protein